MSKRRNKLFLYLILGLMMVAIIFPIYWMILTAFQPVSDAINYPPLMFFKSFSLEGMKRVIFSTDIFLWIKNSLVVSLCVALLSIFLSVPAAYSIARFRIRLNGFILFAVLVTQMIPPSILVVPLYQIFAATGYIDSLWALILADSILTLPLATWIMVGFFENIPREIEESAVIDGASGMMVFYRINLPLTYPALITISILNFFEVWNEYMYGYTFISDQHKWVGTVGLASYKAQYLTDWQAILDSSVVFCILPMLIYIFLRKYIVRGVAEGFTK